MVIHNINLDRHQILRAFSIIDFKANFLLHFRNNYYFRNTILKIKICIKKFHFPKKSKYRSEKLKLKNLTQ